VSHEPALHEVCIEKDAVISRIARHDAVKVLGIALRLAERLLPPRGASGEIGMSRTLAVESYDHRLRILSEDVRAPIGPVANLLGRVSAETKPITLVSSVGGSDGESSLQCLCHLAIRERARVASVARAKQLAVPACCIWQPDLYGNSAVRTGGSEDPHRAMRRQHDRRRIE
jgi:hypothetical protein